ncbi:pantoate--beta-alanine ligase [Aliidiomarina sedimenti]|uniref:Pantothenate synthetase n=1 Tax=Aliidiomarina sedimenti TaxID=1933879 RepID=A0ABY0BV71_9GAMM|nr:pantoate--beta-alanine ligase [Aliidiomarina sedimenti]
MPEPAPILQITALPELRDWRQQRRQQQHKVALVPTMGNLHSGHLKLVREAQQHADAVIVSIYVNPMQFGANEDLDSYPRTLAADLQALAELGVDAVFTPSTGTIYPRGLNAQTYVEVPQLSDMLCGKKRPGHFRGVATIVCKLFNMVQPDIAVFGKKDYQQLRVIRTMVEDLSLAVDVIGVDTEREASGLAKSSRNGYLSDQQKQAAAVIYQQLQSAAGQLQNGAGITQVEQEALGRIAAAGLEPEYFSIRRQADLTPAQAEDAADSLVILAAASLGTTRLIDNLEVDRA